jgi:diguanylate cyclase (GGDEF)-like protein
VISIKKFLSSDSEAARAFLQVVQTLIDGMGEKTTTGEAADVALFRESIRSISRALTDEAGPEDLMEHANSALRALGEHSVRVSRQQALHSAELQNMVKMLTSAVAVISAAGEVNIGRLSEIENHIAYASQLDDVRVIKNKLSGCLNDIRNESERQRRNQQTTIEHLSRGLSECRQGAPAAVEKPSQDTVTRLPVRSAAEQALADAGQEDAPAFAAVLVLDRLQALNLKYGREVGDEVLGEFARTVEKKLPYGDQLFRWGGPSLLAVLHRRTTVERVRSEIALIIEAKLEHNIKTPSRSIMIPIGARWAVFPMMAAPRLLYKRIDTFSAVISGRD